jgi:hypothetical protein
MWDGKLIYHDIHGKLTIAKVDIAAVGYDTLPSSKSPIVAFLVAKRFLQPRLYVRTNDGVVTWLEQFWVPPANSASRYALRAQREQQKILATINGWLQDD